MHYRYEKSWRQRRRGLAHLFSGASQNLLRLDGIWLVILGDARGRSFPIRSACSFQLLFCCLVPRTTSSTLSLCLMSPLRIRSLRVTPTILRSTLIWVAKNLSDDRQSFPQRRHVKYTSLDHASFEQEKSRKKLQ